MDREACIATLKAASKPITLLLKRKSALKARAEPATNEASKKTGSESGDAGAKKTNEASKSKKMGSGSGDAGAKKTKKKSSKSGDAGAKGNKPFEVVISVPTGETMGLGIKNNGTMNVVSAVKAGGNADKTVRVAHAIRFNGLVLPGEKSRGWADEVG